MGRYCPPLETRGRNPPIYQGFKDLGRSLSELLHTLSTFSHNIYVQYFIINVICIEDAWKSKRT